LIKESFLVDENGSKVDGDAFSADVVKSAFAKKTPVFVANIEVRTSTSWLYMVQAFGDHFGDICLLMKDKTHLWRRLSVIRVKLRV
jgi:hypothetical protein